jgi:perosamine synthetase
MHPVTWRWQPPVVSPVSSRALVRGARAALGLQRARHSFAASELCKRFSATNALLTDSGTTALTLALRKTVPHDGVVGFPAYSCIDLTTAALGAEVRVRLYDVDPATLSPDLDSVERMFRRGVDAVVVAHLYGYPADVIGVQQLATRYGVAVIEDAAQAAGGRLCGKPLGGFGELSILSFGRGKGMTSGSGGAVLARTPALSHWIADARVELGGGVSGGFQVMALAAQSLLANPAWYRVPASIPALKLGQMVYHPPTRARAMSAASASILCTALEQDHHVVTRRRDVARSLLSYVERSRGVAAIESIAGGEPGFLRFAVVDTAGRRNASPTIGTMRGYPMTLDQHTQLSGMLLAGERAGSGAEYLRERLFTLPTHAYVDSRDLIRISQWLA